MKIMESNGGGGRHFQTTTRSVFGAGPFLLWGGDSW